MPHFYPSQSIPTVNVVLLKDNSVVDLYSYPDNESGRNLANDRFIAIIKDNTNNFDIQIDDDTLESILDNRPFELDNGYFVDLVYSTIE